MASVNGKIKESTKSKTLKKLQDKYLRNIDHTPKGHDTGDLLRLSNQVCFPLYAASRLMMQLYKPHLTPFGLTYPQYLVLLVLWETDRLSVKEIGERLYLDSATVVQVLSNLNKQGIISRFRTPDDGRTVLNELTPKGKELKGQIRNIPLALSCDFGSHLEQVASLRPLLFDLVAILDKITKDPSTKA